MNLFSRGKVWPTRWAALMALVAVFPFCLTATDSATQNPEYAKYLARKEAEFFAGQQAMAKEIEAMMGSDTELTLYSIEPRQCADWKLKGKRDGIDVFRGYPVHGFVSISDTRKVSALIGALAAGILEVKSMEVALCFDPHHGLTIRHGKKKIDLVICFACGQIAAYGTDIDGCIVTGIPEPIFDDTWSLYKLPLASAIDKIYGSEDHNRELETPIPIEQSFQKSSVVFYGTVLKERTITVESDGYTLQMTVLTFKVEQCFKGKLGAQIEVECDVHRGFSVGEYCVIYGYGPNAPYQIDESGGSVSSWDELQKLNKFTKSH